jgi:hypothetical protein
LLTSIDNGIGINVPLNQNITLSTGAIPQLTVSNQGVLIGNKSGVGFEGSGSIDVSTHYYVQGVVMPELAAANFWNAIQTFDVGYVAIGTPPTAASGRIGYGGAIAASSNCGSLSGAAGCVELNVAGTLHYVPYY